MGQDFTAGSTAAIRASWQNDPLAIAEAQAAALESGRSERGARIRKGTKEGTQEAGMLLTDSRSSGYFGGEGGIRTHGRG